MSSEKTLFNRVALITGASRGIGRAAAIAIAKHGAHVIAIGRVVGALEEVDDEIKAAGGTCTLLPLDLRRGEDIDGIGPSLFERFGKLDILVGNAGILGPLSPLPHISPQDWQQVIEINLTANWRLIRTLDPLLRRSDAGRVVLVSSGASSGKYAYWGPYAVSKAGVEALAKTYAQEMANTQVRVNLVNPGPIRTQMRAKAFPGEDANSLPAPEALAPLFVELVSPECNLNGELIDARSWRAKNNVAAT